MPQQQRKEETQSLFRNRIGKKLTQVFSVVLASAAIILCSSACVRRPKGVVSDSKMVKVVADMELAEAYMQSHPGANRDALVADVVKKHGLSQAEFDSTMAWYGRNLDDYYELYARVDKELERRKLSSGGKKGLEHQASDLWPYSRMAMVSPQSALDGFSFSVPTSELKRGEQVEMKMRFRGGASGTSVLGVEYSDGSTSFIHRRLSGSRNLSMKLITDSARNVNRVFGNLLLDRSSIPLWIDSISMIALPFDSVEYYNIHTQRNFRTPTHRRPVKSTAVKDTDADKSFEELPRPR